MATLLRQRDKVRRARPRGTCRGDEGRQSAGPCPGRSRRPVGRLWRGESLWMQESGRGAGCVMG